MNNISSQANPKGITTEEFAAQHLVKPQTVRKRHSQTGSYHGIRPLRLPSRRLSWPADSIDVLLANRSGNAQ